MISSQWSEVSSQKSVASTQPSGLTITARKATNKNFLTDFLAKCLRRVKNIQQSAIQIKSVPLTVPPDVPNRRNLRNLWIISLVSRVRMRPRARGAVDARVRFA